MVRLMLKYKKVILFVCSLVITGTSIGQTKGYSISYMLENTDVLGVLEIETERKINSYNAETERGQTPLKGMPISRIGGVIGGSGQALLGGAMCSTGGGCLIGGPLIAHGLNNVYEGAHQKPGFTRKIYTDGLMGEKWGNRVYLGVDLALSAYGFFKPTDVLGKPSELVSVRTGKMQYEVQRKTYSYPALSVMSGFEIVRDSFIIMDSVKTQIENEMENNK